jgi:hypothetical protein
LGRGERELREEGKKGRREEGKKDRVVRRLRAMQAGR